MALSLLILAAVAVCGFLAIRRRDWITAGTCAVVIHAWLATTLIISVLK